METLKVTKKYKTSDPVRRIYFIGDLHLGVKACAESKIRETVRTIKDDDNALWIGMGDYCDFVTPHDPRWDTTQIEDWVRKDDIAKSEVDMAIEMLKPIRSKGLCLLLGNHEYKYMTHDNNNVQQWICDGLELYNAGYSCFLNLVFERDKSKEHHQYTGALTHGGSCATTESGKRTALGKWMMQNMGDFYAMGHVHTVDFLDRAPLACSQAGKIINREIMGVISGCFLKTYNEGVNPTYGEMRTFSPTVLGYSMIELNIVDGSMTFRKKIYTKSE